MKRTIQFSVVAAVAIVWSPIVQADLITGNISITGVANFNTSSAATATAVTSWGEVYVQVGNGTFASPPYAVATGTPVTFGPATWNLNTTTPITNFWSVGGFKYEMFSSHVFAQSGNPGVNGFVFVQGSGTVSGNGFTPTAFTWNFIAADPSIGSSWTFSASASSSNSNGAPVLVSNKIGGKIVLSWNDPTFALQSAPAASGAYTNIAGATSPYTSTITGSKQFFRLKQ